MAACAELWDDLASKTIAMMHEMAEIHRHRALMNNCARRCECGQCGYERQVLYALENLVILYRGEAMSARDALTIMEDSNRDFPP